MLLNLTQVSKNHGICYNRAVLSRAISVISVPSVVKQDSGYTAAEERRVAACGRCGLKKINNLGLPFDPALKNHFQLFSEELRKTPAFFYCNYLPLVRTVVDRQKQVSRF